MNQVFFYEAFDEEAAELRRHLPPGIRAGFSAGTVQETPAARPPARLISIRTQSVLPPDWAGHIDGLLGRCTGFDHLLAYRTAAGRPIALGYLPRYCARAVAEQALLLWTALLRRLPLQMRQFATFHRDGLTGRECLGKTLTVIGVGQIGHEIVCLGRSLGMEVLGVDLVQRHADVTYVEREEGLRRADVLVCAMNLTADNASYFSSETFGMAERRPVFVNIARGELAPAPAILQALERGWISAAGLDVYARESDLAVALRQGRTPTDEEAQATLELASRPDVICTPHNAFNTHEAVERKAQQSIEQVLHFLDQGAFIWPVPGSTT